MESADNVTGRLAISMLNVAAHALRISCIRNRSWAGSFEICDSSLSDVSEIASDHTNWYWDSAFANMGESQSGNEAELIHGEIPQR